MNPKYVRLFATVIFIGVLASCSSAPAAQQPTPAIPTQSTVHGGTTPSQGTPTASSSGIHHIFYIMMENHSYSEIIGNANAPSINQLANSYGIATHYYSVTHPSLPNYLAAISGSFQGIWDDCSAGSNVRCKPADFSSSLTQAEYNNASSRPHLFSGPTVVDQLAAHHLTWKAYMQSLPAAGYTGGSTDIYAQWHDPFVYFSSIRDNPARVQQIVPFTQFQQDMRAGNIANFVWITPDLCNDMHGTLPCTSSNGFIAQGDTFVHSVVQQIMGSSAWKDGTAIVITWDEDGTDNSGCCNGPTGVGGAALGGGKVPLIVISSANPHHMVLNTGSYNHYSLLATIESLWHLGCLASTCNMSAADLLTPLFSERASFLQKAHEQSPSLLFSSRDAAAHGGRPLNLSLLCSHSRSPHVPSSRWDPRVIQKMVEMRLSPSENADRG
jgi:hypothetical protein